jgi:hypothetical protein
VPALEYFIAWVRPQSLRVIAETKDPRHIDALIEVITDKFAQYPGMRSFSSRGSIISSNDGGTRSVNVDIAGSDLPAIYDAALAAYRRAYEVFDSPQVRPDPPILSLGQPLLELHPHWERAAELGLTGEEIGYAVAGLTDGAYVDELFVRDDKIDIYLYTSARPAQTLDEIVNLPIYTPQGTVLPVGAVADLRESVDTNTIRRVDGRRTVTLNVIPPRSVALETGVLPSCSTARWNPANFTQREVSFVLLATGSEAGFMVSGPVEPARRSAVVWRVDLISKAPVSARDMPEEDRLNLCFFQDSGDVGLRGLV